MPLRMRSRRPIASEPWCTTQVFPLSPLGVQNSCPNCVLFIFLFSFVVFFFLISFVLRHHRADRHSSSTPEVQKEEEKKFKEVGEAFTILSDPKKKIRYDNGHDLDDDGSFSGRGNLHFSSNHLVRWFLCKQADSSACFSLDFDANDIFRAFFGGHNDGFSFGSGQGMWFVRL